MKKLLTLIGFFGFYPLVAINNLGGLPAYFWGLLKFRKKSAAQGNVFKAVRLNPQLQDKSKKGGDFPLHYFWQDLYVAQKIFKANPKKHVDIGSRIDGFVTHVASFREIELFDIRPCSFNIPNVSFKQVDFMDETIELQDYCDSISSLHVIEHLGLGRYGDTLRPDGYLKGFANIHKLLQKDGLFYFSVPMGSLRVEFNAHRVFSLKYLLQMIAPLYSIVSFSYISDSNELIENAIINKESLEHNFGCQYGCAIFVLKKLTQESDPL